MKIVYTGIKKIYDNKEIDIINKICISIVGIMILLTLMAIPFKFGSSDLVIQIHSIINDSVTYLGLLILVVFIVRLIVKVGYEIVDWYKILGINKAIKNNKIVLSISKRTSIAIAKIRKSLKRLNKETKE